MTIPNTRGIEGTTPNTESQQLEPNPVAADTTTCVNAEVYDLNNQNNSSDRNDSSHQNEASSPHTSSESDRVGTESDTKRVNQLMRARNPPDYLSHQQSI